LPKWMMCAVLHKQGGVRAERPDGPVLAGVDIGTLTCRLLIGRVAKGRVVEIHSDRRILRLGEGVQSSGRLQPAAMARVLATLQEWRATVQCAGADAEVAVATSAVRDALNREEFVQRAKRDAGFDIEILPGGEEARRTMLGIRSGLPHGVADILGLDIGGGSTEFILDRAGEPPRIHSLDLGVVRLTEALLRHDPPTPAEREEAMTTIKRLTADVRQALGDLGEVTLVGTAGTVTTLAALALGMRQYEPVRIQNYALSLTRVIELEQILLERAAKERRTLVGLEPGREDVIVAGTLILHGVMESFGFGSCLVSDLGLREGIVLDLAQRLRAGAGRGPRGERL
jgi:exopolyphosphatase/guanosine-5'-triphosphate,3'-diphosphate pyrophosphatase